MADSIDLHEAISLRKGAKYASIDYGAFLQMCKRGMIRTELKSPTGKRLITKRVWIDEARRQWDKIAQQQKAGKILYRATGTPRSKYEGLSGAEIRRMQGV